MLTDGHGRRITYLRLAVTDRCNLRCRYCMPAEGIDFLPRHELLTFEEILQVTGVLAELGVNKVRLTGGEPLVRRDIEVLVDALGRQVDTLAMTTNALLLRPRNIDALMRSGLRNFNVSLDTLRAGRFQKITRRTGYEATRTAIDWLLERGARVKLNCVVMRGVNADELLDFVALTEDRSLDVRFIEAMPFNATDGNKSAFISYSEMLDGIREAYPKIALDPEANSSALRYRLPGHEGNVGLIPAYSRSLCGSCNRLRMTSEGTLLNCLYSTKGLELRPLLRSGIDDAELANLIRSFVLGKHVDGHATERAERSGAVFNSMTSIGG